jgi:tetratricopeptide (TPR) repeat protein
MKNMRGGVPDHRQQRAAATEDALRRADILKSNPGHSAATAILCQALLMQRRPKEAVPLLEKAARRSRDPEIETQLAIVLRQIGHAEEGLEWLNRAIKRKPPSAAAFYELGLTLKSLYRHDESIEAFRQGVAVAPGMIDMMIQLGYAYHAVNDRANAQKAFAQAYAMNPQHSGAIHSMCTALLDENKFAQAAELFRGAFAANPADTAARIGLGYCLLNLGDTGAAFACFRTATLGGPQFYARALKASVSSARGRFWLHPSAAARFFRNAKT